jgi:hypothetical protein
MASRPPDLRPFDRDDHASEAEELRLLMRDDGRAPVTPGGGLA